MTKELSFAWYATKKNLKSHAELRTSFMLNVIGMAINNSAFVILWWYFAKSVGAIGGWQALDVVGLLGFSTLSFGIVFSAAMGIRKLPDYVANGVFDRFMLSPKNLLLRTATAAFNPSAVGDIVFGIVCLAIYGFLIHAGAAQIILLLALVVVTSILFIAAAITIYSTSFYFMDSNAVSSGLFELFLTPSLFHGGAFQGAMRFVFTFIIPSLLVGALPVEVVRDISFLKFFLITILAVFWFGLSIFIFNKAVRRYESANFTTFGGQ